MATVIIPAHNEATVISRCIDSLIGQEHVSSIIVACNNCTDSTAEIVKRYDNVLCIELDKASKTNAINEAEKYITSYPVFYIDADTYLEAGAVQEITRAMENGRLLLAAPAPFINTANSSWVVKSYYRVWQNLPYVKEGVIATCSYVLTREGRERFTDFPEIISDDGFVRGHFKSCEMANIESTKIYIDAPKDITSLIKIKTRSRLGNLQLKSLAVCPLSHDGKYRAVSVRQWLAYNPIDLAIYTVLQLYIRLRASIQFNHIDEYKWERDSSVRE